MGYNFVSTLLLIFFLWSCSHDPIRPDSRELVEPTPPQEQKCQISLEEREALLKLDYKAFDQTLPDGGWRKYQNCPRMTRDLIDAYTAAHLSILEKRQRDILIWHSGQISGFLGDYSKAISSMKQTLKEIEKPTDAFLWNPYVRATIAFLSGDKSSLLLERQNLSQGSSPFNHMNLRIVDSFVRCFGSPYKVAYSKTCEPKETNIERIRSLAVRIDSKEKFPSGVREFLEEKKIILIGEIHGTQEVPELFGNIVATIASEKVKTLVVLEINQTSQSAIDAFLKTRKDAILARDVFFSRKYQDGRSSKAMVGLLRRLSKLPNVTVLCLDPPIAVAQERDTGMASFINSKMNSYDHTLILSGNVHSSTVIGTPWDKNFRPMGYELKSMATNLNEDQIFNILVRYEKVDSWNCQGVDASSCFARYGKKLPTDYSMAENWNMYFLQEDALKDGHLGTIFIRSTRVSFPLIRKKN